MVPQLLIPVILSLFHFKTHSGYEKLSLLIKTQYTWKGIDEDIKQFCKGCLLCNMYKAYQVPKNKVGFARPIFNPLNCVQIDVVSGLVSVKGYDRILTCIDMFSGYVVPIPLRKDTSQKIAEAFENHFIKQFGVPQEISSDNASNLSGPAMRKLCAFYSIKHRKTTPYMPTSHGMVENANKGIVTNLKIFSDQFNFTWLECLPIATYVMNAMPRTSLKGNSPYFIFFGREPNWSDSLIPADEDNLNIEKYKEKVINNRNFCKLVVELLYEKRKIENLKKGGIMRSYPEGSLIYVKILQPQLKAKLKPFYMKVPFKVVSEYPNIVYAKDYLGRIQRHSKNNIRPTTDRSIEMFEKLPLEMKFSLGGVSNSEEWEQWEKDKKLPSYFFEKATENFAPITRTKFKEQMAQDHYLLQDSEIIKEDEQDDDLIEKMLKDEIFEKIKGLHSEHRLLNPTVKLKDILTENFDKNETKIENIISQKKEGKSENTVVMKKDYAAVDPMNIIKTPRQRKVRFSEGIN